MGPLLPDADLPGRAVGSGKVGRAGRGSALPPLSPTSVGLEQQLHQQPSGQAGFTFPLSSSYHTGKTGGKTEWGRQCPLRGS